MPVIHPHARQRAAERGSTEREIIETVETGERFPAKHGRTGFRKNFEYDKEWNGHYYAVKQVFKSGDLKQAEQKAFRVFCSNTYLIDKFFGRPIVPLDKYENSNIDIPEFADHLTYLSEQPNLTDFASWLDKFTKTEKFVETSQKFIDIYRRLKTETDSETRHYLIRQARLS